MLSKRGSQTNDVSDKRGKAQPANKKDCETSDLVNHHILGYNPSISHYQRSLAPNRLYISPEHNISALFKDVCSRYEDVKISYAYYYKKVKKMNISFVKFGEEECERCDLHDKQLEVIQKLDKHELSKPDENGKNRKQQPKQEKDIVRKRIGNGLTTRKLYLLICRKLSCCQGFLD